MPGPLDVIADFTGVLDELGIKYVVVGSFASSARGFHRATADVDILAEISPDDVDLFCEKLVDRYYVDELSIRRAIANHRSFNAIHLESMFKVDVYIPRDSDLLSRQQLIRRLPETIFEDSDAIVYLATAEDTILAKLVWYRKGQEVSDRQWADVLGIIRLQAERLDQDYLEHWAERLEIRDLLNRAFEKLE